MPPKSGGCDAEYYAALKRKKKETKNIKKRKAKEIARAGGGHDHAAQSNRPGGSRPYTPDKVLAAAATERVAAPGQVGLVQAADCSPLSSAVEAGELALVQRLLDEGADPNLGETTTSAAAKIGKFMCDAARKGDVAMLQLCVDRGADPNKKYTRKQRSLLHYATWGGQLEVVRFLIENGAHVGAHDSSGRTAVHDAASNGHLEVLRFLAAKGADLNQTTTHVETPALLAARAGHADVLRFLATELHPSNLNQSDYRGASPTFYAAANGHVDVLRLLADNGAGPSLPRSDGVTPRDIAVEKNQLDVQHYFDTISHDLEAENLLDASAGLAAARLNQGRLQSRLGAVTQELAKAKARTRTCQLRENNLQQRLKITADEAAAENKSLQRQLDSMTAAHDVAVAARAVLYAASASQSKEIAATRAELAAVAVTHAAEVEALKAALAEAEAAQDAEAEAGEEAVNVKSAELEGAAAALAAAEAGAAAAASECTAAKSQVDDLRHQLQVMASVEDQSESLRLAAGMVETENRGLQSRLDVVTKQFSEATRHTAHLQAGDQRIENQLSAMTQQFSEATSKATSLLARAMGKTADLVAQNKTLRSRLDVATRRCAEIPMGNADVVAQNQSLQSRLGATAQRLADAMRANSGLCQRLREANSVEVVNVDTGQTETEDRGEEPAAKRRKRTAVAASCLRDMVGAAATAVVKVETAKAAGREEAAEAAREDAEDAMSCVVCMDKRRDVVFTGCSHMVCCFDCATGIRMASGRSWAKAQCPMCRVYVKGIVKGVRMPG